MGEHASYLSAAFVKTKRKYVIKRLVEELKPYFKRKEANGIYVSGLSGALIGSLVAHRLNTDLVVMRKGEVTHSYRQIENAFDNMKLIIVDDLIASGATVRNMERSLRKERGEVAGIALYRTRNDATEFDGIPIISSFTT